MSDILADLRSVQRVGGDTYSSMEVLGMVGQAADEIDRLRAALQRICAIDLGPAEITDPDWKARLMQEHARAALTGGKE